MYTIETSPVKTRPVQSRLALVAVTLCAALLVAALAVAMPFMRFYATPPNNPAMTGNQALPPAVNQPKAVYIANSSGILKLDPNTGNTLNSYPWPHKLVSAQPGYTVEPFTLQMGGKLLYAGLKVRNSSGHLIYGGVQAFDPSEGEMLWGFEGQTVQNAALTLANGIVYLSVDHPDIVGRSLVFALRATDGRQLNDYDLPLSIEQLTVAGGFLYPLGYDNFYGVNLATGATWHISGSQGANQGFSDLHVASGVLYVSLYTKCTGSVILALNPATGKELWRTRAIPGKSFNFTIVEQVAYFGTDQAPPNVSGDDIGRFDAYDLGQRKLLWETAAPSGARTYAVATGRVYAVTQFPYAGEAVAPQLIALTANHGKLLWTITAGSQDDRYTPVVTHGHIYIATSPDPRSPGRQLEMVNQANGKTLWKKSFSSQVGGYVVV